MRMRLGLAGLAELSRLHRHDIRGIECGEHNPAQVDCTPTISRVSRCRVAAHARAGVHHPVG
jgi:hypothetical protein